MAGFNTAVTGLKSASQMLDVAGNNIANSSTVGFKSTRTEFADIYATSVVGAGASNQPGSGVTVSDISQDFSAGTIEFTNNNLDLAINGSGFFQLDDGQGSITYTRAGSFELDKDGFIVSKNGKYLQGYGLDALGNVLPLQNLSVTQKESPPKSTENIDLSFNIDSSADSATLARTFDKNNPSSYTYSTTVETVDSLGNANSIRFYMVEQAAYREQYEYDVAFATVAPGDTVLSISTIDFTLNDLQTLGDAAQGGAKLAQLEDLDPRIDIASVIWADNEGTGTPALTAPTTGQLFFEFSSKYTDYGDISVVPNSNTAIVTSLDSATGFPKERAANEVQTFQFASSDAIASSSDIEITIGDVLIELAGPYDDMDELGAAIETYEREMIDRNPAIETVVYDPADNQLVITFKAEVGEQDIIDFSYDAGNAIAGLITAVPDDDPTVGTRIKGDNDYLAVYRTYAYLNDETALDIGKPEDPGEGDNSEVGPILVEFESTTGALKAVNGELALGGNAPLVTIAGADPANPNDTVLDGDVDGLPGIQLDITGSSQFASESIVKAASQDGYPKGDLIGVTFAETGEMVASFSNGQRQNLGLVAIASFENQAGLRSAGATEWIATLNSGAAILNPPGTGLNGTLRSAALESSNVDLSAELVKLIEAQRNFQANSKTLETQNTVTQAILQI